MIKASFNDHLRTAVLTLAVLAAAAGFKLALGDRAPANDLESAVEIMGRTGLNESEEGEMTAGYYEGLLDGAQQTTKFSRGLLGSLASLKAPPPDWQHSLAQTQAVHWTADFMKYDMQPNVDIPFKGDRLQTNRWGQRDKDYELAKPPATRRIALIGSSICMGSGVPLPQTYQALLEDRLNASGTCPGVERYEIINFSVPGYMITQLLELSVERAPRFAPDVIILGLNDLAVSSSWCSHIATLVRAGDDLKYDFLKDIVAMAHVRPSDSSARITAKLDPYKLELIEQVIRTIKARCDQVGTTFVIMNVPFPSQREALKRKLAEVHARITDLQLPVIDALDSFGGRTAEELRVREWDNHPNAIGHELIFQCVRRGIEADARLRQIIFGC